MRDTTPPATVMPGSRHRTAARLRANLAALMLGTALVPGLALADGFTIVDGQTADRQQMYGADQIGIIEAGGAIEVSWVNGVEMYGAPQTLQNYGAIRVLAGGGYGVYALDDYATIDNFGTVSTLTGTAIYTSGDGTTVNNAGAVVTNGSNAHGLYGIGNNVTMINSGTIETSNNYAKGIYVAGDDNIIVNSGEITTNGYNAGAVVAEGANVDITNTGLLLTYGERSDGIKAVADGASLANSGSISASGKDSNGMAATGANSTLTNSGTITTTGLNGVGMFASGANATITNLGSIISQNGTAVISSGGGAYVENRGSISTTTTGFTISLTGSDNHLVNYGNITSSGAGSYTAFVAGTQIENFGTLTSTGAAATTLWASTNSQTINYGEISAYGPFGTAVYTNSGFVNYGDVFSNSSGTAIDFDSSTERLVNFGTIAASGATSKGIISGATGAQIENFGRVSGETGVLLTGENSLFINSGYVSGGDGGAIFVGNGGTNLVLLAGSVVDGKVAISSNTHLTLGTGLNAIVTSNNAFVDVTSVSNPYVTSGKTVAVLDRAGLALTDDMLLALADDVGGADTGPTRCLAADMNTDKTCDVGAWIGGFGGTGRVEGTDDLAGRAWGHGGIETGLEFAPVAGLSAGAYVAGLSAHGEVGSSQDTDISGGAVGAHLGYDQGGFFADLSASYGLLDITSKRSVADNTVSGGLATATADSTGSFVSPTLAAGARLAMGGAVLTPSLRLRYTHLALDGYAETGANDNLVVDDRSLDELALRAQLALGLTPMLTENGELSFTLRAGADGKRRTGDGVTANLLGSDISFASGSAGESYGGFVGADLDYRLTNGIMLSGDIEYAAGNTGSHSATARATLSAAF